MRAVPVDHYENFPVASVLCPPRLRPAVLAIYGFARTADDIADEGGATPAQRLAELADYRRDLEAAAAGSPPSPRWAGVFAPLAEAIAAFALPAPLLHDLLDAFEQDLTKHRYADRADLLDYCRRSANPVGRLLLHLYGVSGETAWRQSDAICSALQLINFWQDLRTDTSRGRVYPPLADCARHGVAPQSLLQHDDSPAVRRLVAELCHWARTLMHEGAPLVHTLPGRAGWELRLVVQGGLRVLDKIEASGCDTLRTRPKLHWYDGPSLLWRAARMPAAISNISRITA